MSGIKISKVVAMGLVAYCMVTGMEKTSSHVTTILHLPRRIITMLELREIDRLIKYELTDAAATGRVTGINLTKFCETHLETKGKEPGRDSWNNEYKIFHEGKLQEEVWLYPESYDRYIILSAAQDEEFLTEDDLTSKTDNHSDVKQLLQLIEEKTAHTEEEK